MCLVGWGAGSCAAAMAAGGAALCPCLNLVIQRASLPAQLHMCLRFLMTFVSGPTPFQPRLQAALVNQADLYPMFRRWLYHLPQHEPFMLCQPPLPNLPDASTRWKWAVRRAGGGGLSS